MPRGRAEPDQPWCITPLSYSAAVRNLGCTQSRDGNIPSLARRCRAPCTRRPRCSKSPHTAVVIFPHFRTQLARDRILQPLRVPHRGCNMPRRLKCRTTALVRTSQSRLVNSATLSPFLDLSTRATSSSNTAQNRARTASTSRTPQLRRPNDSSSCTQRQDCNTPKRA